MSDRSLEFANKIIAKLEEGYIPWRSVYGGSYDHGGHVEMHATPANIVSLRPYEGKNYLNALIAIGLHNWKSAWFATYKQWQENDCVVKKGEKSISICSWREKVEKDSAGNVINTDWVQKWFAVFNLHQVEALSEKGQLFLNMSREIVSSHVKYVKIPSHIVDYHGEEYFNIPQLDNIPAALGVNIKVGGKAKEAFYDYKKDVIQMPAMTEFESTNAYYTTLLHECVHATGLSKRIGRIESGKMLNDAKYAREELIAEFATILLADYFGTVAVYLENHAGYIQHWIRALKAEPKYLMDIMGDAVKAKQFILEKIGVKNGGKTKLATGSNAVAGAEAEVECVPA